MFRYERSLRRLVPRFVRSLGVTPLVGITLERGSYVCLIRHPDCDPVRYPVHVGRLEHWDGVPPGGSSPRPVRLPLAGALGPDDVYVPPGWFQSGGDPETYSARPHRRLWCDGFVMRRFPVTNRNYIAFLEDLERQGRREEAEAFVPRVQAATADQRGAPLYERSADGHYDVMVDAWQLDWPVLQVDWHGAAAYARWAAERSGHPWRLPAELEWEKAARGVDGRWFPWGDGFDWSFCRARLSSAEGRGPSVVRAYRTDRSPYGIRGLGGNSRDWCLDLETQVVTERVAPLAVCAAEFAVRGGAWNFESMFSRAAERSGLVAGHRDCWVGFRLCRYSTYSDEPI